MQFGSLATGERTMLRGCELGNGAYSVVEHVADDTKRVSPHELSGDRPGSRRSRLTSARTRVPGGAGVPQPVRHASLTR
jgi:hypothetical protein